MAKTETDKKQKNKAQATRAPSINIEEDSSGSLKQNDTLKIQKVQTYPLHPLEEMLGTTLKHSNGTSVSSKTLAVENGVIGLYFAAHWCPPCKMMSSQLALLYDAMRESEKKFDVVFISFDYSEESFTQYFSKMPWYAIDYKETDKREELAEHFTIRGIPVLILIEAETSKVITPNGRDILNYDPLGKMFPWKLGMRVSSVDTLPILEVPSSPGHNKEKTRTQSPTNKISESDLAKNIASVLDNVNKD